MSKALQSEFKSWRASSAQELTVAETEQEYKLSGPPDLGCILCKNDIDEPPVYQAGHLACFNCSCKDRKRPSYMPEGNWLYQVCGSRQDNELTAGVLRICKTLLQGNVCIHGTKERNCMDHRLVTLGALGHSVDFDLDSSSTLVLLRHVASKDFHLLHQESSAYGLMSA